jgi:hypothetical protein
LLFLVSDILLIPYFYCFHNIFNLYLINYIKN